MYIFSYQWSGAYLADKLLFLLLDIDDLGFDGIFGDELVDVDFLLLADTVKGMT